MSFVVDMHKRTHSKLQSTPSDASSTSILASFFPSASSRNIYPPKRFPTLSLQDLANDLRCLLVSAEELLALLALALDRVILVQQLLEELLLVQLADKTVLDNVFAVVDEQVHDGFGDLVGSRLAYDGKV